MPGLTTSLLMATQALMAQQGAINATANNIANVNTPGYSRQEVILTAGSPIQEGNLLFGSGVVLEGFQSVRDKLLDLRIQQETQHKGYTDSQVPALQQIQALFTDSKSGIGATLSAFFTGLQTLSTNGQNPGYRNGVITAAQNLATAFHQTVSKLADIQSNLNLQVAQDVNKVNELMQQIAELNVQVSLVKAQGQDPGVLDDQRTELVRQLSELIDVSDVQTAEGDTLTTANGMGLVVGAKSFDLEAKTDSSGFTRVYAQGKDITAQLRSAQLGGAIQIRDSFIPELIGKLNAFAGDFADSFNTAHKGGVDLLGNAGEDFFSGTDASTFGVEISDPNKIAASTPPTVAGELETGNIKNVTNLINVRDKVVSRQPAHTTYSADAYYSALVFEVGNTTAQAQSEASTADLSLRQLQNQRNALSGVSIDEETANLLRYQHAFQAAARIISTVDDLTKTIINIGA